MEHKYICEFELTEETYKKFSEKVQGEIGEAINAFIKLVIDGHIGVYMDDKTVSLYFVRRME